jgi:hypothetical protein
MNPSAAPSDLPSLSANPSAAPSDVPSLSMNPSAAPSDQPSKLPSNLPSLSNSPSASPSSEFDRVFQITTTFDGFDDREWCLTAASKSVGPGSKLYVRPCVYYDTFSENLQLFTTDQFGELLLAGPGDGFCVKSQSRLIRLDNCVSTDVPESIKFSLSGDGYLAQLKFGNTFYIGFDTDKRFSRVRLYKQGAFNQSVDKWKLVYGLPVAP